MYDLKFSKVREVKSPSVGSSGSAGIDFFIPEDFDSKTMNIGDSILIPAGIKLNIPENSALIAFNKSGIATKKGLSVGACVGEETLIETNKGLFPAAILNSSFVQNNEITIKSYDIEKRETSFEKCDGFRISNNVECFKIIFEDDSELIVSEDHKILNENGDYVVVSSLVENNLRILKV